MARSLPDGEADPSNGLAGGSGAACQEYSSDTPRDLNDLPHSGPLAQSAGHAFHHDLAAADSNSPSEPAGYETDPDTMENPAEADVLEQLRQENAELRQRAVELEELLAASVQKEQQRDQELQEFEKLMEEKSEVIRQLHLKMQEVQKAPGAAVAAVSAAATPREEELLALHEELEQERRQLTEDEETLMQQMRQMEVQMAKERAEIARHRNELQRLHNDIRHELELASREAELRDRLQPLQRRHQEMSHRRAHEPPREAAQPPAPQHRNGMPPVEPQPAKPSGLFKRLFG